MALKERLPPGMQRTGNRSARAHSVSLLAIPVFALVYLAIAHFWHAPSGGAMAYVAMSLLCFVVYALDKSAARSGRWRISESTLLVLGLLCGWPGAVMAQQLLRHKSNKASFLWAFWATVVLNVAALLALSSPQICRMGCLAH